MKPDKPATYGYELCVKDKHYIQDERGEWYIDGIGDIVECDTLEELEQQVAEHRSQGHLVLPFVATNIRWVPDPDDDIDGGFWQYDTDGFDL